MTNEFSKIETQFRVHRHWYQLASWRWSIRCYRTTPLEQSSTVTGTSSRLGDGAFAAAGPHLWNSLPPSLVPVHVLEMEHSLLPDHTFGTVFRLHWYQLTSWRWSIRCCRTTPLEQSSTVIGTSSRLGDGAFAAAGPHLWNSLPTHVR